MAQPRKRLVRRIGDHLINEIGNRHGTLTVISRTKHPSGDTKNTYWICQCDCGREVVGRGGDLRQGKHKTCGHTPCTPKGENKRRLRKAETGG